MKILSVVIPVFNEQGNLKPLVDRLVKVLDKLNVNYEIILINDGSTDDSLIVLQAIQKQLPTKIVIIDLLRNFGQHAAVLAGFSQARGKWIITLDADLQNPPEEITKLWFLAQQGYDLISGVRLQHRQDSWFRCKTAILANQIRARITNLKMTDQGSMLRCYRDYLVKLMVQHQDPFLFIPSLAYQYARQPIEIQVQHDVRYQGKSKYSLWRLIGLYGNLIFSNSTWPLRFFSFLGFILTGVNVVKLTILVLGYQPENEFNFYFTLLFLLGGLILLGIGTLGEYIGRIYQNVSGKPQYVIKTIIDEVVE